MRLLHLLSRRHRNHHPQTTCWSVTLRNSHHHSSSSPSSPMFSFVSVRNWISQVMLTIFSFILTPIEVSTTTTTDHSIIPDENMIDILLRLDIKSLMSSASVSQSWYQLIYSPYFVNTHLKLNPHRRRVLFPCKKYGNLKSCCLSLLFIKKQLTKLVHMDPPVENPMCFMMSVNGLVCLFNRPFEIYIWNPTISKSKKLRNWTWRSSLATKVGFGYDASRDDYKIVFINYFRNSSGNVFSVSNLRTVVSIYSLRTNSWRTVDDQLDGIFLLNHSGIFVNGKLYWASSTGIGNKEMRNIISFDLADETWGSVELPVRGEDGSYLKLGVVGNDLSLLYTCGRGAITSDVWILKDCGFWTKLFTITYPKCVVEYMRSLPICTFSIHFLESNKGDFLFSLLKLIMIGDGSTGQLKIRTDVGGNISDSAEIFVESLVDPLRISGQGRRIHGTSQSLS